jgi:hypothetical protein
MKDDGVNEFGKSYQFAVKEMKDKTVSTVNGT